MNFTVLETVHVAERPNLIWLQVHTDEGVSGLGETVFGVASVAAHIHEYIGPPVIGRYPFESDRLAADVVGYLGCRPSGVAMRGSSAFDIALWDIFGKALNRPNAQLPGGVTRRKIRTYNTCAGTAYVKKTTGQVTATYCAIPMALSTDLCPHTRGYGSYGFGVVCEDVPRVAAGVDDVVVAVADGDGALVGARVGPDVFARNQLGVVRRQGLGVGSDL